MVRISFIAKGRKITFRTKAKAGKKRISISPNEGKRLTKEQRTNLLNSLSKAKKARVPISRKSKREIRRAVTSGRGRTKQKFISSDSRDFF